jgi:hypothetical protein
MSLCASACLCVLLSAFGLLNTIFGNDFSTRIQRNRFQSNSKIDFKAIQKFIKIKKNQEKSRKTKKNIEKQRKTKKSKEKKKQKHQTS